MTATLTIHSSNAESFTDIFVSDTNGRFTLGGNENGKSILVPASDEEAYTYPWQDDVVVGRGDDYSFFFHPTRWRRRVSVQFTSTVKKHPRHGQYPCPCSDQ
jgi:hypothetical protein